jgi:hypothetical protein
MTKQCWLAAAATIAFAAALFESTTHVGRGWWRGEAFYGDRPTSYWRGELGNWRLGFR